MKSFTRLGVVACAVLLSQMIGSGTALAVPSEVVAWQSLEDGITVYRDADPARDTYWFIPRIRFEANAGKTVLRPSTLANGKVQYVTRIIPYFTREMRELVAQNLSNVRQDSQLRPVVAKDIGIALPDFGYTFKTASVTNYQYLDIPRLVRFSLEPEEAALFDELYQDQAGVNVEFTITYDGMMTDKLLNIEVSCKQIKKELESGLGKGSGGTVGNKKFAIGADIELAFKNTLSKDVNNVNVVSKGEFAGMDNMLRQLMNTCFTPVDEDGRVINDCGYYACDDRTGDRTGDEENKDGRWMPKNQLNLHFKYKSTTSNVDNQSVTHQVSLKDTTTSAVLVGTLAANAQSVASVTVKPFTEKRVVVGPKNSAAAPLASGIKIGEGEQYTINAELIMKAATPATYGIIAPFTWDASWPKPDGDLYYRIGTGSWTPVNRRAIITSDVIGGGGELQFYIDRSSLFNRIPDKFRKGNILVPAKFVLEGFAPEYSVQVSGRKVEVK